MELNENYGVTESTQESYSLYAFRFALTWHPTSPKILEIKTRYEAQHSLRNSKPVELNDDLLPATAGSRDV